MGLLKYHFELGFPDSAQLIFGNLRLKYSLHAQGAAASDRYGSIKLPTYLDTESAQVIEIETDPFGTTTKLVYRTQYDLRFDLVLVVHPDGFVRTVWLNDKQDKHKTLRKHEYQIIGGCK